MLTDEQKHEAALVAMVGCDRETIAKYVGCRVEELVETLGADADFATDVRRAEAGCELAHMRSIQQAARDERHWRASVWWLERRLPERYARRSADAVGRVELGQFLARLAETVASAVQDQDDREAVLAALTSVVPPAALPRAQVEDSEGDDREGQD